MNDTEYLLFKRFQSDLIDLQQKQDAILEEIMRDYQDLFISIHPLSQNIRDYSNIRNQILTEQSIEMSECKRQFATERANLIQKYNALAETIHINAECEIIQ